MYKNFVYVCDYLDWIKLYELTYQLIHIIKQCLSFKSIYSLRFPLASFCAYVSQASEGDDYGWGGGEFQAFSIFWTVYWLL